MSSPAPSLSQKTGLEPNYPTPGPSVGALGALGALGTEPKCSWLASSAKLIAAVYKVNRQDKTPRQLAAPGLGVEPRGSSLLAAS